MDDDNFLYSDSNVDGEGDMEAPQTSTKEQAMEIFYHEDDGNYVAVVNNIDMYHLVLEFEYSGASFCMVNCLVHSTCMKPVMNSYKGCMEVKVAALINIMFTLNLQVYSRLLCNMWALVFGKT